MNSRISSKSKAVSKNSFHKTLASRKSTTKSKALNQSGISRSSFAKTLPKSQKSGGGILNLGDLGPSKPLQGEMKKKGMVYSKNKVNAIMNRIKSPIVVNSQQTYYSSRFEDFEKSLTIFQNRQQVVRSKVSNDLEAIRQSFEEMQKKVEASRNHKKDLVDSMKQMKLTKAKFSKANTMQSNLMEKDDKKHKKMVVSKVNALRKDLNIIRIDGEQRLNKLSTKVHGLLSEFKEDKKNTKFSRSDKKGKAKSAQKVQKMCLAYVKRARLLIKDHQNKLNYDFENSLKMKRDALVVRLSKLMDEIRDGRRKNHFKLHEFVHNTDSKVNKMLEEKKEQVQY